MRRLIMAVLAAAIVGAVAYAIYGFNQKPVEQVVLDYDQVTAQSRSNPNWIVYPRTRRVRQNSERLEEVELPGGVWKSCEGDCAEVYRRGYMDIGETAN